MRGEGAFRSMNARFCISTGGGKKHTGEYKENPPMLCLVLSFRFSGFIEDMLLNLYFIVWNSDGWRNTKVKTNQGKIVVMDEYEQQIWDAKSQC